MKNTISFNTKFGWISATEINKKITKIQFNSIREILKKSFKKEKLMEFVLLTWLKMNFYYVDTYKDVNECISKAEILFKDRSEYMCLPKDYINQQRIVKGIFSEDMLKSKRDDNKIKKN